MAALFVTGVCVGAYGMHLSIRHYGLRSRMPLVVLLTTLFLLSLALLLLGVTGRKAPH